MSTYTLNFIDGVGNMKIYSPMKNNIPVGIAKVKFDLSGGGGVNSFFSLLICQRKNVIMTNTMVLFSDSCGHQLQKLHISNLLQCHHLNIAL